MKVLEVKNLVKHYGKKEILHDVSFSVEKGEVKAILGPSGSGKSTLLRCLNGLEEASSGHIYFDGQDLLAPETHWVEVRQRIGMVFQNYELFPNLTVLDNVLLGPLKVQKRKPAEAKAQALQLLERVGLDARAQDYPRQLSGGQKQRVAIVRALAMNPEVMLFDEVTASLDPEMVREVLEVIKSLAEDGTTMVLVTHEMQFARQIADEILFIDEGKAIENDSPEMFFNHPKTERAQRFLDSFTM